jgi:DNA-binding NtrC family response regulator
MASILIIDDDVIVRMFLRSILEDSGHEITEVSSGRTGLDSFRLVHADVVFLDMNMPGLNGVETLRYLIAEFPSAVVIVMSGGETEMMATAIGLGAKHALQKPFTGDTMRGILAKL